MNRTQRTNSRRSFLRAAGAGLSVLPLAGLIPVRLAAAEMLSPEDPTAKALGYVEESTVEGQRCSNCNFWQGGDADAGPCPLFPGKHVTAGGWCKSWLKKA